MDDEREAEGFPRPAGEFGAMRGGGGGERGAADVGKIDAGFFEHGAAGEDAGEAAAGVVGALPGVFAEAGGTVGVFERGADRVLKSEQAGADGGDVGQ